MKLCLAWILTCLLISSCGLPGARTWQERRQIKPVGLSVETLHKVFIVGTAVSIVRNPFTGTHKGLNMLKSRSEILGDIALRHLPEDTSPPHPGLSIDQALNAEGYPKPIPGHVDFLIGGKAFFGDLNREVNAAEKYVDTQIFIFDNDDVAAAYANLLKKKSKNTRCRVLFDHMGSIGSWWSDPDTPVREHYVPPISMVKYLKKDSRVKVRLSRNPWLVADHSKLILIDGKTAYLGGMNIGREYRYDWHDMMMKVRGPLVTVLQNHFNKSWRLQGGIGDWGMPFYRSIKYRKTRMNDEIDVRILKTKPSKSDIKNAMLMAIKMSKKRIFLHISYFTSEVFLRELLKAQRRGVDVRMVIPNKIDSEIVHQSNLAAAKKLTQAKAKVYLFPMASHMKAVVIDDWACVGSANLDGLSLRINDELNIAFSDKKTVDRLVLNLFEKDFKQSKLLKNKDVENWEESIFKAVADQL